MIPAECVIWAYRLFLNRDPEEQELADLVQAESPDKIRSIMLASAQFASMLDRAGRSFEPRLPVDFAAGVQWAFRLLLQREPNEAEIAAHLNPDDSLSALRLRFVLCREFELHAGAAAPLANFAVINAFAPFRKAQPTPGHITDFLGTRTSVQFLPGAHHFQAGQVYGSVPRANEPGLHGTAEWIGTLRSVLESGERFTAVELGAGWAPWLIVSATAAKRRGIADIRLVGVEASTDHFSFMRQHFETNDLDPDAFDLFRAIIAPADGVAHFPKLHVGSEDYGANAVFAATEEGKAAERGELEEVRAIGLGSLLAHHDRIDLLHIDIQGHEEEVLRSALPALNQKVRRMVVGTHSRAIEGHLLELLSENGWIYEFEQPCKLTAAVDGQIHLMVDGEQVWRNPKVPSYA